MTADEIDRREAQLLLAWSAVLDSAIITLEDFREEESQKDD